MTSLNLKTVDTLELINGGAEYFERITSLIEQAQKSISLQFYIFRDDNVGRDVGQKLKEAAKRGVRIHMLLDALGCMDLPDGFIAELRHWGVFVEFYRPLRPWKRRWGWGRRLHRKVIVVDDHVAIVGGINIGEEYAGSQGHPGWLDFAIFVEGPVAHELEILCEQMWWEWLGSQKIKLALPAMFDPNHLRRVQPVVNHYFGGRRAIHEWYLTTIRKAERSVVIVMAYFLPDTRLLLALKAAARRGVSVKLVFGRQSDVPGIRMATHFLYDALITSGISIFEYTKSVVHAKAGVIDSRWVTIGSYNLDPISIYSNHELNMIVDDENFSTNVDRQFSKLIQTECVSIDLRFIKSESLWAKMTALILYVLARILLHVPIGIRQFIRRNWK